MASLTSPSDTINLTNVSSVGNRTRNVLIVGSPNTVVKFVIKNIDGETYNSKAEVFQAGVVNILTTTIGSDGEVDFPFLINNASSNQRYRVSIRPSQDYVLGKNVKIDSGGNVAEVEETTLRTIQFIPTAFTAAGTGRTAVFGAKLSCTKTGTQEENSFGEDYSLSGFNQSGSITVAGGQLLYVTPSPINLPNRATGHGHFDNAGYESGVVVAVGIGVGLEAGSTKKITFGASMPSLTAASDFVWGGNLKSSHIVAAIEADIVDKSISCVDDSKGDLMSIKIGDVLYMSGGGHAVDVTSAEIIGSGTASLTASYKGYIDRFGSRDVTVGWNMATQISGLPNAYDMAVSCSISEATTSFSLQDGNGAPLYSDSGTCSKSSANNWTCTVQQDVDANKDTKVYDLVSKSGMTVDGELKGTIGNNSTAFDNDTWYTGSTVKDKITFKYAAGSAGDTCSFTYRARDAGTACSSAGCYSATKTVTITLTA